MTKYVRNIRMPNGDILTIPETDISNCATTDLDNITEAGKDIIKQNSSTGFNLFDTKVVDHILQADEAVGWLLQGSLVTMVYPDAVNEIKELYEGGSDTIYREIACKMSVDGRYIADISQKEAVDNLFETTGIADFYILDSANNQFYLPRSKWFHQFTLDTSLVNNYNEAGLPDHNHSIKVPDRYNGSGQGFHQWIDTQNGTTGLASASNPIYGNSDTVQPPSSNKLLYYKVGDVVINETSIDVAEVLNEIQTKLDTDHSNDTKPYITETYVNGTSGYIIYSDDGVNGRYCEQWGVNVASAYQRTINLIKSYKDLNYSGFAINRTGTYSFTYNNIFQPQSEDTILISSGTSSNAEVYWRAFGYIA